MTADQKAGEQDAHASTNPSPNAYTNASPNDTTDAAGLKEASDYYGHYLIKDDKCGTPIFDRLLRGIAKVISQKFEPSDSPDLTPTQIAAFYRAVGGNYDVLFIDTPPPAISFIYTALGAFHSLQPAPGDEGYSAPTIPALKYNGFVKWQTIQLLLGPEEHVPLLQKAVEIFDVEDQDTGGLFPKILPKSCFPDKPDSAMEAWYQSVAETLKVEAEKLDSAANPREGPTRVRVHVEEPMPRSSDEFSNTESADDRQRAASYFSDPLYRKQRGGRPAMYVHHVPAKQPSYVEDRGRVATRVRHLLNPFHHRDRRRSSGPDTDDDDFSDNGPTPIATVAPAHPRERLDPRYQNHKRPHPPRRDESLSSTESSSDSEAPPRHRTPTLRHRRSHDGHVSPREYFPPSYDERRYSHDVTPDRVYRREDGPPPLYGPTKSPLFATHVAQMQAQNYIHHDHRPSMPPRASYRPHNVRYTVRPTSPHEVDVPYPRERERDLPGSRPHSDRGSRDRRDRDRRRSEDYLRDRDRSESTRTRSHDGWDDRDRDRDRERERDRDRDRRDRERDRDRDRDRDRERDRERDRDRDGRLRTRYSHVPGVAPAGPMGSGGGGGGGVQDGVSGRRYPVPPY